jgi:hypothetical protein
MSLLIYSPMDDLLNSLHEVNRVSRVLKGDTVIAVAERQEKILVPLLKRLQEDAVQRYRLKVQEIKKARAEAQLKRVLKYHSYMLVPDEDGNAMAVPADNTITAMLNAGALLSACCSAHVYTAGDSINGPDSILFKCAFCGNWCETKEAPASAPWNRYDAK